MPGSKSANLAPKEIAKCDNLPEFVTIGCVEVATPEIKDAIHPEIDHYPYIYIYICGHLGVPQDLWPGTCYACYATKERHGNHGTTGQPIVTHQDSWIATGVVAWD